MRRRSIFATVVAACLSMFGLGMAAQAADAAAAQQEAPAIRTAYQRGGAIAQSAEASYAEAMRIGLGGFIDGTVQETTVLMRESAYLGFPDALFFYCLTDTNDDGGTQQDAAKTWAWCDISARLSPRRRERKYSERKAYSLKKALGPQRFVRAEAERERILAEIAKRVAE